MIISAANTSMLFHSLPMVGALKANGLTPDKAALAAKDAKEARNSVEQVGRIQKGPEGKAALRDALKARIADDVASGKLSADDASIVMRTFQEMDPANQRGGQPPAGQDAPQDGGANQPPPRKDRPAPAGDEQNPPPEGAGGPPPGGPGGPPPGGPGGPPPQGAGGPPPGEAGARPARGAGGPPPAGGAGGPPKAGGGGQSSAQKTVLSESVIVTGAMQTTTTLYTDGTSDTKTEAVSNDSAQSSYAITALANYMNAIAQAKEGPAQMQSYLSSIKPGSLFDFLIH
jgi:hypothetical protein